MKNILFIFSALVLLVLISDFTTRENIIPEDAIRIRVIANSNSDEDQNLKLKLKDELQTYIYNELTNVKTIEEANQIIEDNLSNVNNIVEKYTNDYNINYGMNYFPEKEYKGLIYEEGEYQSLVVTLGSGVGNNWWCVLFPPLCLLEAEESTDVEYRSYVAEIVDKYINN